MLVELLQIGLDERGVYSPWTYAVHPDRGGIVHGDLPGDGYDGSLSSAVSETALHADQASDGTDVHNAAMGGNEQRQGVFGDQKKPFDVDAKQALKIVERRLFNVAHQANAGVINKYVEGSERNERLLNGGFLGNIEDHGGSGKLASERLSGLAVDVSDNDAGTGGGECTASGGADAAGSAGDQCFAPVESERGTHPVNSSSGQLAVLQQEVIACRRCPRLVQYIAEIGRVKRRAYRDWEYWAKPVPSFGDPQARVLIVGLAPGAHGSNRTGRPFTGDASGAILYRVLYRAGFASQPESRSRDDELQLLDARITAAARCAPPGNKPTTEELRNCRPFLERELELMTNLKVVVALGKIAFDVYLSILRDRGVIKSRAPFVFGHNVAHRVADGLPVLLSSYHPSQQNTSTGKLNEKMLLEVFRRAKKLSRC